MQCDACRWKGGYVLDMWESGAGNWTEFCKKGHWEGGPLEEGDPDPWRNCPDFEECLTCILCGETDGSVFEREKNGIKYGPYHYKCSRKKLGRV